MFLQERQLTNTNEPTNVPSVYCIIPVDKAFMNKPLSLLTTQQAKNVPIASSSKSIYIKNLSRPVNQGAKISLAPNTTL